MVLLKPWVSQNSVEIHGSRNLGFLTVMHFSQSRFFSQTCLAELIFSRLKMMRSTDLFISYI